MLPTVIVTARGAARLRAGNPWVYADDVKRADDRSDVVRVTDGSGKLIGTALHAPGAQLPIRLIAREEVTIDAAFLRARLEQALARRTSLFRGADAFRMVHGEADLLPGLIVDRYADVAVIQTTARAMDAREPLIAQLLVELLGARLVVARDDGSARDFEGLPRATRILHGSGPTSVIFHDAGSEVEIDVTTDGKTGAFLDQAENHARASEYARPSYDGLDAFAYHGGYALALARGGCASVLALDENPAACARARRNAERNGFTRMVVEQANAFDRLRALESERRSFDVVVIDPPALAKRKSALRGAERAYKELNLRGLRLTRRDGILISCSCSGKLSPEMFGEILVDAAKDAGRSVQLLERRGAGRDHPPLVGVPETEYLKCWILRVLD
jgi:23S rRNA (cytosine1962-C5)-methyltransferase